MLAHSCAAQEALLSSASSTADRRLAKWRQRGDPEATREARKYLRPIASREHLLKLLAERGVPLTFDDIANELALTGSVDRESLQRRLGAMQRDGQIILNRRQGYGLINKMDLVRGRVAAHRDGFGFLIPDSGGEDLYLPNHEMRAVLHNDRVVASITGVDRRGRKIGTIVEVLTRGTATVVGRLTIERGIGFVVSEDNRISQEILIPPDQIGDAKTGQIVLATLVEQPTRRTQPMGRVTRILGERMTLDLAVNIAVHTHGLPDSWPTDVQEEAAAYADEIPETDKRNRVDLRKLPLVTIDGPDARDFDDAVCCKRTPNGWKLLVAIADVSAYVKPGTALDHAARERGNSVYFPRRVIPMLPESLSLGLCSLVPQADRLCLACEMLINREGRLTRSRFFEGIMRSQARLTYQEMATVVVTREPELRQKHQTLAPHLDELYRLYQRLNLTRRQRGAIEFDRTETQVIFTPDQKVDRMEPLVRNDAHRIIEECMVTANVAAARFLERHKLPTLYRVHDGPALEKLADLRTFLKSLGLRLSGGDSPEPAHYGTLLQKATDRPDTHLIQTVLLRSLSQAQYRPDNQGHFGLSLDCYTHFTSPIRRYPDLLVHRAIRHVLAHGDKTDFHADFGTAKDDALVALGAHCSATERRADDATRDVLGWLKCDYMADKVGEVFAGIITAVTSFGLFVELDNIYIEGLVHISTLGNDYYHYDPIHHCLTGERTHNIYRLADPITVQVMRVDQQQRRIEFELLGDVKPGKRKRGKSGKRTTH